MAYRQGDRFCPPRRERHCPNPPCPLPPPAVTLIAGALRDTLPQQVWALSLPVARSRPRHCLSESTVPINPRNEPRTETAEGPPPPMLITLDSPIPLTPAPLCPPFTCAGARVWKRGGKGANYHHNETRLTRSLCIAANRKREGKSPPPPEKHMVISTYVGFQAVSNIPRLLANALSSHHALGQRDSRGWSRYTLTASVDGVQAAEVCSSESFLFLSPSLSLSQYSSFTLSPSLSLSMSLSYSLSLSPFSPFSEKE